MRFATKWRVMYACAVFGLCHQLGAVLSARPAPDEQGVKLAEFDVASIRRNDDSSVQVRFDLHAIEAGRIAVRHMNVRDLVGFAYAFDRTGSRVVGGPSWIDHEYYDINATFPPGTVRRSIGTPKEIAAMLRNLMLTRFHLAAHEETRDEDVYHLVLASRDGQLGPHLHPARGQCPKAAPPATVLSDRPCTILSSMTGITGHGMPLAMLAGTLKFLPGIGREVEDRTGLAGRFDFTLEFDSGGGDSDADGGARVMTALREQLGLKLQPTRGTKGVVVVDAVSRPTPN